MPYKTIFSLLNKRINLNLLEHKIKLNNFNFPLYLADRHKETLFKSINDISKRHNYPEEFDSELGDNIPLAVVGACLLPFVPIGTAVGVGLLYNLREENTEVCTRANYVENLLRTEISRQTEDYTSDTLALTKSEPVINEIERYSHLMNKLNKPWNVDSLK